MPMMVTKSASRFVLSGHLIFLFICCRLVPTRSSSSLAGRHRRTQKLEEAKLPICAHGRACPRAALAPASPNLCSRPYPIWAHSRHEHILFRGVIGLTCYESRCRQGWQALARLRRLRGVLAAAVGAHGRRASSSLRNRGALLRRVKLPDGCPPEAPARPVADCSTGELLPFQLNFSSVWCSKFQVTPPPSVLLIPALSMTPYSAQFEFS
jgi:hypothetical protein